MLERIKKTRSIAIETRYRKKCSAQMVMKAEW
jgi:hypothetical protein